MPQKHEPNQRARSSFWEQEEPGIRIPYQVVRHALSKSGPVRIHGLDLARAGDVVILRAVNLRDQPLAQFIEMPLHPTILRRVAAVLEDFAAQAERESAALRRRLAQAERRPARPRPAERTRRAVGVPLHTESGQWRSEP